MAQTILHVDLNNFYDSVECQYHPELRAQKSGVSNKHMKGPNAKDNQTRSS